MDNVQLRMHSSKFPTSTRSVHGDMAGLSGDAVAASSVVMTTGSEALRDTCHRLFQRDHRGRSMQSLNSSATTTSLSAQESGGAMNINCSMAATEVVEKNKNATLTKKYQHIKGMLSNKFNRGAERSKNAALDHQNNGPPPHPPGRQTGINSSFRRAIHKSAPNINDTDMQAYNIQHVPADVVVPPSVQYGYTGTYMHMSPPPVPQGPFPTQSHAEPATSVGVHVHKLPPSYAGPPSFTTGGIYGSVVANSTSASPVKPNHQLHAPQQQVHYQQLPLRVYQQTVAAQRQIQGEHFGVQSPSAVNGQLREPVYSASAVPNAHVQGAQYHVQQSNNMVETDTVPKPANSTAAATSSNAAWNPPTCTANGHPDPTSRYVEPTYMSRQQVLSSGFDSPRVGPSPVKHSAPADVQYEAATPARNNVQTSKVGLSTNSPAATYLNASIDSEMAASGKTPGVCHSSGNDSEWVDVVESELRGILEPNNTSSNARTPPLPAMSLNVSPCDSAANSPQLNALSYSAGALNQPDLIEAMPPHDHNVTVAVQEATRAAAVLPHSGASLTVANSLGRGWNSTVGGRTTQMTAANKRNHARLHSAVNKRDMNGRKLASVSSTGAVNGAIHGECASVDIESVLDQTTDLTSDDDADDDADEQTSTVLDTAPDGPVIRKQLESLEKMYSEVLRLLGAQQRGAVLPRPPRATAVPRHRMYGSMSSLPSSVAVRPDRRRDERRKIKDNKIVNKRFQRLESHVVTLARSVAHLSSEIRTQHVMFQELESMRAELSQLRAGMVWGSTRDQRPSDDWEAFRGAIPSLTHPARVRKLTKFFGDEPPLLRIFLKKLGYEKFAHLFEREKIGMIELPYMSEERLQKLGIPVGPRLRILQEAQMSLKNDNPNVYIL